MNVSEAITISTIKEFNPIIGDDNGDGTLASDVKRRDREFQKA